MSLKLYVEEGVRLEVEGDRPLAMEFVGGKPQRAMFERVLGRVQTLLGHRVITWGAFTHATTGAWWCQVGDAKTSRATGPSPIELLPI